MIRVSLIAFVVALSGCSDLGITLGGPAPSKSTPHLLSKAEFETLMDAMFDPKEFFRSASSQSSGGDELEFTARFRSNDPIDEFKFDFSTVDTLLKSKDTFSGYGKGGSVGLYWTREWSNSDRFITVDGFLLHGGSIMITYREFIR